jgi:hypothetical protein
MYLILSGISDRTFLYTMWISALIRGRIGKGYPPKNHSGISCRNEGVIMDTSDATGALTHHNSVPGWERNHTREIFLKTLPTGYPNGGKGQDFFRPPRCFMWICQTTSNADTKQIKRPGNPCTRKNPLTGIFHVISGETHRTAAGAPFGGGGTLVSGFGAKPHQFYSFTT